MNQERVLTPFALEILMHYYVSSEDHPTMHNNPPAWRPTVNGLLEHGLLEEDVLRGKGDRAYNVTEKGTAYIEAILSLPLPVAIWIIPPREK